MTPSPFKDKFVAFVDILGFKQMIKVCLTRRTIAVRLSFAVNVSLNFRSRRAPT